jgi:hypothetical protein
MYLDFLSSLNHNRFVTDFHKLTARRLQQDKQLTKMKIQQMLFPLPRELNAMETIAS